MSYHKHVPGTVAFSSCLAKSFRQRIFGRALLTAHVDEFLPWRSCGRHDLDLAAITFMITLLRTVLISLALLRALKAMEVAAPEVESDVANDDLPERKVDEPGDVLETTTEKAKDTKTEKMEVSSRAYVEVQLETKSCVCVRRRN